MMSDTKIVDWLEINMTKYLIVPPEKDENEWSIYENGHIFISRANSLRELIQNVTGDHHD